MEKIKVIIWDSEEGGYVYRLDNPEDAQRFFKNILDNAETDGRENFSVREITQADWNECVDNGVEE